MDIIYIEGTEGGNFSLLFLVSTGKAIIRRWNVKMATDDMETQKNGSKECFHQ